MHVEGDVDQILRDRLANEVALLIRAVHQELLAEVVPERICVATDQTSVERTDLTENNAYQS